MLETLRFGRSRFSQGAGGLRGQELGVEACRHRPGVCPRNSYSPTPTGVRRAGALLCGPARALPNLHLLRSPPDALFSLCGVNGVADTHTDHDR